MRRRDFMALVGGTAGTWPFAANAQGATKRPFIGVMVAVTLPDNPPPAGNRGFDTVAELPRNEPDTTFPSNTGNTYAVTANSFSDLQSKVNMAAKVAGSAHHYINVPPGTYSGTLNLPARTGSGWIVIQSNGSLPAQGTRVQASNSAQLAKIVGPGRASSSRCLTTSASTHNWRLVGLFFTQNAGVTCSGTVDLGNAGVDQTGIDAHHIGIDRCLVTGRIASKDRCGIALNCGEAFVIDSGITQFVNDGTQDAKAIASWNGTGPYLIQNNDLSSSAECTLFGGTDPATPGRNPADVTIRHNRYFKDPAWLGLGYGIKNLAENKKGIRFLYENNIFEQCYTDKSGDTQDGQVFNLISRNQDGTDPTAETRDVTIRYNVMRNCNKFLTLNSNASAVPSSNFSIHDNLIYAIGVYNGQTSLRPYMIQTTSAANGGIGPIVIKNNTMICDTSELYFWFNDDLGTGVKHARLVFTDNIAATGRTTPFGKSAGGSGTTALNGSFTTYTWQNNLFIGTFGGATYPAGQSAPVATIASAGLASTSPSEPADYAATRPPTNTGTGGSRRAGADVSAVIAATGAT